MSQVEPLAWSFYKDKCWSVGRLVIRLVGLYVYGDYLIGACVEIFDTCTDLHCRGKKMKNKLGLSWAKLSSSWLQAYTASD